MTEDQLSRALRAATDGVESDLRPDGTWRAGRVRRRRALAATTGLAAASVAVVAVTAVAVTRPSTDAGPAPAPPGPTSVPSPGPDLTGVVERDQLLPVTDPATWSDLPAYPEDLGYWLSPQRPAPLAEDPVDRATAALQYDLGGSANVVVIGDDGRWRSLDLSGLDLDDGDGGLLGLHRGSLSPDGTRLALGLAEEVVVVDLTTAESTAWPVTGLGPAWSGRYVFWEAGGDAVLLSRGYWVEGGAAAAYPRGWRVDLDDGAVTRVPYDPEHAALLGDGSVLADQWSAATGHEWYRVAPDGGRRALDMTHAHDVLGVLNEPTAGGDVVVARRELTARWPDREWDRGGFVALDGRGEVLSALPVRGVDANGGGGRVLGWVGEGRVALAMPGPGGNPLVTVVWDVADGTLWRGPELLADSRLSLPGPG